MTECPGLELSVVSAVYGAEGCLEELYRRTAKTLEELGLSWELILIDDRSPDGSWLEVVELARRDGRVKGLRLSRNFGQHAALCAGLARARGAQIVLLDCDLQDPPEEIGRMLAAARAGAEVVLARRVARRDSLGRRLGSATFFRFSSLLGTFYAPGVGTFSLLSRRVARELVRSMDLNAHYLTALRWLGFETTTINVQHAARFTGSSGYSLGRLMRHAAAGLTSHSTRLLQLSSLLGAACGLAAFGYTVRLIYRRLVYGIGVEGWASLMVVNLTVGGAILLCLGVVGLYLARLFDASRGRPRYIVAEETEEN